jgi:PBP1b-binding outer membrane lipoprotein LpoB
MRRWLVIAVLALVVGGCKSLPHPVQKEPEAPKNEPRVPNGELSPFDQ